jgi:hypothetical protein
MLYAKALHQVIHEYLETEALALNTTVEQLWPSEENIHEITINGTHIIQAILKNQSYQSKTLFDSLTVKFLNTL